MSVFFVFNVFGSTELLVEKAVSLCFTVFVDRSCRVLVITVNLFGNSLYSGWNIAVTFCCLMCFVVVIATTLVRALSAADQQKTLVLAVSDICLVLGALPYGVASYFFLPFGSLVSAYVSALIGSSMSATVVTVVKVPRSRVRILRFW